MSPLFLPRFSVSFVRSPRLFTVKAGESKVTRIHSLVADNAESYRFSGEICDMKPDHNEYAIFTVVCPSPEDPNGYFAATLTWRWSEIAKLDVDKVGLSLDAFTRAFLSRLVKCAQAPSDYSHNGYNISLGDLHSSSGWERTTGDTIAALTTVSSLMESLSTTLGHASFHSHICDPRDMFDAVRKIEVDMREQVARVDDGGDDLMTCLRLGVGGVRRQLERMDAARLVLSTHLESDGEIPLTIRGALFLLKHETVGGRLDWFIMGFIKSLFDCEALDRAEPLDREQPLMVGRFNNSKFDGSVMWDTRCVY
jgi:hypothetical protein